MAISLKDQLRILKEGIHYHRPFINVLIKGMDYPETRAKATQMFYDFYALELLRMYEGNDEDPTLSLSRFRDVITNLFDEVTIQLAHKLDAQLRMGLVQEFRHLIHHSSDWLSLRQHLVSIYNQTHKKISDEELKKSVSSKTPGLRGHEDTAKRLLLFCKYYHPMHPDPADYLENTKTVPVPKDKPLNPTFSKTKKIQPEPDTTSASAKPEPDPLGPPTPNPDDPMDYSHDPLGLGFGHGDGVPDAPEGADWDEDNWTSQELQAAAEKAKDLKWIWNKNAQDAAKKSELSKYAQDQADKEYAEKKAKDQADKKKQLKEEKFDYPSDYVSGKMIPNVIHRLQVAIKKSGLTWKDMVIGYNNLSWSSMMGGARWGVGVEGYIKLIRHLSNHNIDDMAQAIDHIYDLQHNTGALLNKGGMYVAQKDLDRRAKTTHVARFLPYVSPLVKRMIIRLLPYISKHPEIDKDINKVLDSPTQPFPPEQEATLVAGKCSKGHIDNTLITDAPFLNKNVPPQNVSRQYTIKFHTNGMYSVSDSLEADEHVFDTFNELEEWLRLNDYVLVKHVAGHHNFNVPVVKSAKDKYIDSHQPLKLDAAKETMLFDQCKMAWRPSMSYYKARLIGDDRLQFHAFTDGTFLANLKSSPNIATFTSWEEAFNYCKQMTKNALPLSADEYAEGKDFIGKPAGYHPTHPVTIPGTLPSNPTIATPTVGAAVTKEYSLNPVEINTLQILAGQKPNVKLNTAHPSGMVVFNVNLDNAGSTVSVLWVGKKTTSTMGQSYVVRHVVLSEPTEIWNFSNWNQTYNFISKNFDSLTQPNAQVKNTIPTSTTSQLFSQPSSEQLPANSTSKASYNVHHGIDKPPTQTIRLTVEDEDLLNSAGFTPKMVGKEVWYVHDKVKTDVAKFYPNNMAKIIVASGNTVVPVTKKIDDAIAWIVYQYQGATVSPLVTPAPKSTVGSKAGGAYEKLLSDAGFEWYSNMGGSYWNNKNQDTIKIFPFPKSTFTDGQTGQSMSFGSLPALGAFLLKKKVLTPSGSTPPAVPPEPTKEESYQHLHDTVASALSQYTDADGNIPLLLPGQTPHPLNPAPNKVDAIKHLRKFLNDSYHYPMVLGDAKWCIENFKGFMNYIKNFGLPMPSDDIKTVVTNWAGGDFGVTTPPSSDALSSNEIADIQQLASKYNLLSKPCLLLDKKYILISTSDSVPMYAVMRYGGQYKVFSANDTDESNWKEIYSLIKFENMMGWLNEVLYNSPFSKPQFPSTQTTPTLHPNGMTDEEFAEIQKVVNQFGKTFWAEFVLASGGQTSHVKVYDAKQKKVLFEISALGNSYHIKKLDGGMAFISNFLDVLEWVKDKLKEFTDPVELVWKPDERTKLEELLNIYSTVVTYDVNWGGHLKINVGTITKFALIKTGMGGYNIYRKVDDWWEFMHKSDNFTNFLKVVADLLSHIMKALTNSKIGTSVNAVPDPTDPTALSPSELEVLKALMKQLKLPTSTFYNKSLMEAKNNQKAYGFIVYGEDEVPWIKIQKKDGKYILYKNDVNKNFYYIIKKFATFKELLIYTEFFLKTDDFKPKEIEKSEIVSLTAQQVSQIKDLGKKYIPKGQVRRKTLHTKGVKEPYLFIHSGEHKNGEGMALFAYVNGTFLLYKILGSIEHWENIAFTSTFEQMYDVIHKALGGGDVPVVKQPATPVLTDDQVEWLQTFMTIHNPQIQVRKFDNGVVGAYDTTNQVNGADNPLFVIRFEGLKNEGEVILQIYTENGGGKFTEQKFVSPEQLFDWLANNFEVATQLFQGEQIPEAKLPKLLQHMGFTFSYSQELTAPDNTKKMATVYDTNDLHKRVLLFHDGTSRFFEGKHVTKSKDFKNIAELVAFLEKEYNSEAPDDQPDSYSEAGWTTGNEHLDDVIKDAGFNFNGAEKGEIVLTKPSGEVLIYHTNDHSSSIQFSNGTGKFYFVSDEDLEDHLLHTTSVPATSSSEQNDTPPTDPALTPSKDNYKTEDDDQKASFIKLNAHDENILKYVGFEAELGSEMYKNDTVNPKAMISFKNNGKAIYAEDGVGGNVPDLEFFDSIPHALKFLVVKYKGSENPTEKDEDYFKAPKSWKEYNPYAPVPNPTSIKPEAWQDGELGGYGFKWNEPFKIYNLMDDNEKMKVPDWESVRFDSDGSIIYFYEGGKHKGKNIPGRRYFISKDFAKILEKIEVIHSGNNNTFINTPTEASKLIEISDKLKEVGFTQKANEYGVTTFERPVKNTIPTKMMQLVSVNPEHDKFEFSLTDGTSGSILGTTGWLTINMGLALLNEGPDNLTIHPVVEIEMQLNANGFKWNATKMRYEHQEGSGYDDWLLFYGDGTAEAFLMKHGENKTESSLKINSIFSAIIWSDAKDFEATFGEPPSSTKSKTPVPFSNFPYSTWAKGKGHNPEGTIWLMGNKDNDIMKQMGWIPSTGGNNEKVYINPNGNWVHFFVNGKARLVTKVKEQDFNTVKELMQYLWDEYKSKQPPVSSNKPAKNILGVGESVELSSDDEHRLGLPKHKNPVIYYADDTYDIVFWENGTAWVTIKKPGPPQVIKVNTHSAVINHFIKKKKEKTKPVLPGTEDMPWSGMDYELLWMDSPSDKSLKLFWMDDDTIHSLGWHDGHFIGNVTYHNGPQKLAFYNYGGANYWSDSSNGGVTQTFPTVESVLRWLWKNKNTGSSSPSEPLTQKIPSGSTNEVPFSNVDYKAVYGSAPPKLAVSLSDFDSKTMKNMKFFKVINSGDTENSEKIRYEKLDTKEKAYFFADGTATYWQASDGPHYFGTFKELMQYLWDKHNPNIQEGSFKDYLRKWLL